MQAMMGTLDDYTQEPFASNSSTLRIYTGFKP